MSWEQEEDAFAFRYYLSNEGLGPALNVEHGLLIGETEFVFGYERPLPFKSLQPGEFAPPLNPSVPDPVPPNSLERFVQRDDLYRTGEAGVSQPLAETIYFCRYESLFGERWELAPQASHPNSRTYVGCPVIQTTGGPPSRSQPKGDAVRCSPVRRLFGCMSRRRSFPGFFGMEVTQQV